MARTTITYAFVSKKGADEDPYHGILDVSSGGKVYGLQHLKGGCVLAEGSIIAEYEKADKVVKKEFYLKTNESIEDIFVAVRGLYNEKSYTYPNCCYGLCDSFCLRAGVPSRELKEGVTELGYPAYADRFAARYEQVKKE